jgi:hypothetical protein
MRILLLVSLIIYWSFGHHTKNMNNNKTNERTVSFGPFCQATIPDLSPCFAKLFIVFEFMLVKKACRVCRTESWRQKSTLGDIVLATWILSLIETYEGLEGCCSELASSSLVVGSLQPLHPWTYHSILRLCLQPYPESNPGCSQKIWTW